MSNNFGYIDIILLAMIAGFIILRLRNILGRKTGHEEKVFSDFSEKTYEQFKKQNTDKRENNKNTLDNHQKKDFLKGAELAYESIITAFAKGEKNKLKSLLTIDMNENFTQAIEKRNQDKVVSDFTFVGMKESKLENYEKIKNQLYATVKFVSEIISVKKNQDNKIIDGDPDKIKTVTDHWKFTKSISNNNPNWQLSEIISK